MHALVIFFKLRFENFNMKLFSKLNDWRKKNNEINNFTEFIFYKVIVNPF
jgi:hypothetical protein